MKLLCLACLFVFCCPAIAGSPDFERRYLELIGSEQADAASQQVQLLTSFFGISPPEINEAPLDRSFFIGISDAGYARLQKARYEEVRRTVEELNCRKLTIAKLCQILVEQPNASAGFVAEQKAAARDMTLRRQLNRYEAVFFGLSDADQQAVRQFNQIAFEHAMPDISNSYREILKTLAKEYPAEFREGQETDCLVEQRDDQQLYLMPEQAAGWQDLGPLARCEKTKEHARDLMLVCPENFDPQDEDKPCLELLSPDDEAIAGQTGAE